MEGALTDDRLIVALDMPTLEENLKLVDELEGVVTFFKVGLGSVTSV
ncbi:MAG: orotidine 5'-phosphate decarboxylase / HUMPS family protein [Pseudomonadota bacterium]